MSLPDMRAILALSRDVRALMMRRSRDPNAPERDEFGRVEEEKPRPVLLDVVIGDRPRASQSKFLQMPAEILADIVYLLADDRETLAALALVNSDCRQLSRTCQFAEVHFDYSAPKRQLFHEIASDSQSSIGVCVRKIKFASHPEHVTSAHSECHGTIGRFSGSKLRFNDRPLSPTKRCGVRR